MEKRGQQEIAGFVIIVVLVVVVALIFMVISFRNRDSASNSVEVGALLHALLEQTTECVVREPLPLNFGELIRETYGGIPSCRNGETTRDYLNRTLYETMANVLRMETRFEAWQMDIYSSGEDGLPVAKFWHGSCGDRETIGADRLTGDLRVELKVC